MKISKIQCFTHGDQREKLRDTEREAKSLVLRGKRLQAYGVENYS